MNSATETSHLLARAEARAVRSGGLRDTVIWAGAIFLSAFLLFEVQPLLAKIILPWFGGGAGVWTTSLVFFQVTYLIGNAYAHWLIRLRNSIWSSRVHVALLTLSLFLLPILPSASWKSANSANPALRIFALLTMTIGLPFVLLSATSPLLQAWYAQSARGKWPYRFYALSNAASFLALLTYPAVVEPHSTTRHQALAWSYGYGLFVAICAWIAFRKRGLFPASQPVVDVQSAPAPDYKKLVLWAALAADASALLLAVTNHISQDLAAVPLLWVVPLSLYLLTLIVCFENARWYHRPFFLRLVAVVLAGMTYALAPEFADAGASLQIPLFCIGLFVCCMVCHGELARLKPDPGHLTIFYFMIAAGGALGGIFAGVIAPRIFHQFYELPIALAGCSILTVVCVTRRTWSLVVTHGRRVSFFGFTTIASFLLAFLPYLASTAHKTSSTMRNFYGIVRVEDVAAGPNQPARRDLINGTIVHGIEILESGRRTEATTYYGVESGAAIALNEAHKRGSIRVGIIGLGAGTLATYGQPGDRFTFFEINPLVIQVAGSQFDFLRGSRAHIDIVPCRCANFARAPARPKFRCAFGGRVFGGRHSGPSTHAGKLPALLPPFEAGRIAGHSYFQQVSRLEAGGGRSPSVPWRREQNNYQRCRPAQLRLYRHLGFALSASLIVIPRWQRRPASLEPLQCRRSAVDRRLQQPAQTLAMNKQRRSYFH